MALQFRPVGLPGKEYDQQEESQFRRNLESYLLEISSTINNAESATDGHASVASKRETLLLGDLGASFPLLSDLNTNQTISTISGSAGSEYIVYSGQRVILIPDVASDLYYIKGGSQSDIVTIVKTGSSNNVHIRSGGTAAGGIRMNTASFTMQQQNDNLTLCLLGAFWVEIARTNF